MLEDITSTIAHAEKSPEDYAPSILVEFFKAHSGDTFFQQPARQIGQSGTGFSLNRDGDLIKRASIDSSLQN